MYRKMKTAFIITLALVVGFVCQTTARGGIASRDEGGETGVAASAPSVSPGADANAPGRLAAGKSEADANRAGAEGAPTGDPSPVGTQGSGPTVLLSYGQGTFEKNPIQSFMYFVPLISPTAVDRQTSAENGQQVGVISYERKVTSKSFSVSCEYEIKGSGFIRYTFDPAGMIALKIAESKKPKPDTLTNVLDYIHFEGEGFGGIQIKGTIKGSTQTVTEVELEFNGRSCKSPVVIGLYELKSKNGRYGYENRSNEIVARVESLTFKRSEKGSPSRNDAMGDPNPRMGITVACVSKKAGTNAFLGHLKAAIANLFIKPVKVTPLGNQTLLDFGYAIFERKPAFTFPKATNLKETVVLAGEPKGEGADGN